MFGARISLFVGGASVASVAGDRCRAWVSSQAMSAADIDALIMRICDVMLSFPSILHRACCSRASATRCFRTPNDLLAFGVVIVAIALARLGAVRARRARLDDGRAPQGIRAGGARDRRARRCSIMLRHVLPNVMGPVLVLSTIQVAVAILAEATLSFLGVGVSPTSPSLGYIYQRGQQAAVQRRLVVGDLSGRDVGADRAQHQPVRRLVARCVEPAAALTRGGLLAQRERGPVVGSRRVRIDHPTRNGNSSRGSTLGIDAPAKASPTPCRRIGAARPTERNTKQPIMRLASASIRTALRRSAP